LTQENEDAYSSDNQVEVRYKFYNAGSATPVMQKQKKFDSLESYLKTLQ
jgi:hypothetical protein